MRGSTWIGCIAIVPLLTVAAVSHLCAQPVSVSLDNGVHVRAPFTSVDVFPGGGVRVRAPYTAVDIGGRTAYSGPSHVVVRRPIMSANFFKPADLERMNDAELWRTLREASDRFIDRVGRFDTGITWQRYLRLPDELQTDTYVGDSLQRDAAEKLLQRFDEIANDFRFRKISDLPAFVAMRSALAELIKRPAAAGHTDRTELLPAPRFEGAPADRSLLQEPAKQQEIP
jgi:hypothetical protein